MKIAFEISTFPDNPLGYRSVTETYGKVSVTIDGENFVDLQEILIIEFAYYVHVWLDEISEGVESGFYFRSMDEEDEPILAFELLGTDKYYAVSCWSDKQMRSLSIAELKDELSLFIYSIRKMLLKRYNFAIEGAFRQFSGQVER